MTVEYNNAAANARLAAGFTATGVPGQSVDGNSGNGVLVVGTSALSGATGVLATFPLPKPCGTIASRVLTLAGVPINATPTVNGTAALACLRDSANTDIVTQLSVGIAGSGADIIVSTTAFSTSIPVSVTNGTVTHP